MMFTYHTKETAPAESLPQIERSLKNYGFFPKLHQILAEAPAAYQAYLDTFALFENNTTFSPLEQQVVFMAANYENICHYCVPGHSFLMQMKKMPADVIEALREGLPIKDRKLEALRTYTRLLLEKHGHLAESEINAFLAAGFSKRQALEVLVGLASKLISNFTNSLAHTELDEPVKSMAWKHPSERGKAA
ncbi:MAG: carboxymuconolactone decarboxylase family protein [Hyphomicrobium sp.]|jgi:alkylhydroperoxidase family enzyme